VKGRGRKGKGEEKRIFGLQKLTGLFAHLNSCKDIKTAILFGSFARGDWGKSSDIDLFIYGKDDDFEVGKMELSLGREIQVFSFQEKGEVKRILDPNVVKNIAKGFNIKSNLYPIKVSIDA
jgi:predicted nucleotidyltransferase